MSTESIAPLNQTMIRERVQKKAQVGADTVLRYRWMIFTRFVLAIFGGYYLAAIVAMCIATLFNSEPYQAYAVLSATMLAFVIHCAAFIWIFMVNSTLKAWLGIIIPSLIFTLAYWVLKG